MDIPVRRPNSHASHAKVVSPLVSLIMVRRVKCESTITGEFAVLLFHPVHLPVNKLDSQVNLQQASEGR